jgi:translation initiation factor 2B subunit (eIF-2B alpha/beta/delta family)
MSEWIIAFVTIFGTVASVSGVVAYVFNGTRTLIREMHTATMEMQKEAEQRHREVIEWFKKSDERAEQRHQDVIQQHQDIIELLKKGFGIATR